jgi:hypothetical protein
MPWFADELPKRSDYLQQHLFTVSSYSKLVDGLPSFTIFCNLPKMSIETVKSKWVESIRNMTKGIPYRLHDQYTLFSLALYQLQLTLKLYEMLQGLYVRLKSSPKCRYSI